MFTQIMDEVESGKIGWKGVGRRCENGTARFPNRRQEMTVNGTVDKQWIRSTV
jgi:hypothetical protein